MPPWLIWAVTIHTTGSITGTSTGSTLGRSVALLLNLSSLGGFAGVRRGGAVRAIRAVHCGAKLPEWIADFVS
jgi:hypothetical protein